ncbi:MAG: CPBP family intramembrane metalloprotease [Lachnospiraceae bacterium]|nr:CPBP family intramembrane metalloprotease [Lachnospiraceae bacterium]
MRIVEDRKNAWKAFSRVGIGYGAFLLVTLVIQLEVGVITLLLSRFGMKITFGNWYMVIVSLLNYLVGGIVAYLIIKDMPVLCRPRAGKAGAGMLITGFLVCMSALFFGNLMGMSLMNIVSALLGKPMVNPVEEVMKGLSTWSIFVTMVVMAPICEEILFRKILIDRIRLYGDKAAILVSSVVFGLSHGNFYQFFYAFGIGLVLAYIYIQTGKLRYTIIFHMIINFLGSVVALHIADNPLLTVAYSIFMLGAVIVGTFLFFMNQKKLMFHPGFMETWGKGAFKVLFLNIGMILFFIVSAVTFVISAG